MDEVINMYSAEANKQGTERVCGHIYKKDIGENGEVQIFCYSKNGKLWYTSDEKEYTTVVNQNQNEQPQVY